MATEKLRLLTPVKLTADAITPEGAIVDIDEKLAKTLIDGGHAEKHKPAKGGEAPKK